MQVTRFHAANFLGYAFGWKALGVDSDGNEVAAPSSPDLRAFMEGLVGRSFNCWLPTDIAHPGGNTTSLKEDLRVIADVLRQIADHCDPAEPTENA